MMKVFVCCFILYLFSLTTAGQNNTFRDQSAYPKKNIVKAFYFGPGAGGYNLAFERVVRKKISLQLGLRYIRFKGGIFSYHSYHDIYLQPEIRYYLSKKGAPEGFYFGLNSLIELLKIRYLYNPPNNSVEKEILNGFFLGGDLHLGYQWIIRKTVSIDVSAGVKYINRIGPVHIADYYNNGTIIKTKNHFDESAGYFTPVSLIPSFSFMIGFAF